MKDGEKTMQIEYLEYIARERGFIDGVWDAIEYGREDYVEQFLYNMIDIANELEIEYPTSIKNQDGEYRINEEVNENNYMIVEQLADKIYMKIRKELNRNVQDNS